MVGSALKKIAKENGMTVDKGVAYGVYNGYAVTMDEGAGWKRFSFATCFTNPADADTLTAQLNEKDLKKEYRISDISINPRCITVLFHDDPGTMKKITAFMEWFLPMLKATSATGAEICNECGQALTGSDSWILVDGVAHHMHSYCAEKVAAQLAGEDQQRLQEDTGSYLGGLVGALVGALIGAVVWALILMLGYVAAVGGLLIGFLALKGYDLLKGKQGRGKVAILIVAVVFGVIAGNFIADAISLGQLILAGELYDLTFGDIPSLILVLLLEEPEYLRATLANCGLGLLFAALGVFGLIRRAGKEVAPTKVTILK